MIDLTIKTLDSRNHSFSVADDITVKQLKEQIADSVNVSAESQRLIYCGRVLQDDKKLSEYDVNGKVIHLVQRAPPPAGGSSNDGGGANASGGGNRTQPSQIRHRLMRGERRLLDGGNAMYLGAMAIPTDFMESQGMTISQPTRVLVQSRLTAAGQMLTDAAAILNELEHPSASTRPRLDNVSPPPETATPGTNSGSNQVSGSIAAAAQVATAAAIAAAVSANIPNASDLLNLVADEGDDQSSPEEAAAAASTLSGAAAAPVAADAAQQSAEAATAGAASAAGATAGAASADANHVSSTTPDQPGRRRDDNSNHFAEDVVGGSRRPHLRPSAMARVMESLADVNRRLQPFMERVQTIMRDDPVLDSPEETQRMYKRVSEVMHYLSHAYHALSDIMCDFSRPPPRVLRCRPVLIQHSAVVQTEIPIQAQINVRTNNSLLRQMQAQQNNAGSQTSAAAAADDAAANSTPSPAATSSQRTTNTSTANAQTSTANAATGNTANAQTNTRGGLPNVWLRGGLPSGVPGSGLAGASEGASGQPGAGHFNIPGNLEVYMDYSPGSITIDSLEATVVTNSNSNSPEINVVGGSIPWGATAQNPGDFIQSLMQALTGQLVGATTSPTGTPATGASATGTTTGTTAGTTSGTTGGTGAQASQARGNTATHPTTSTQTRSTARPHVHFGTSMPGLGSNDFDPYLPCNSHHVTRRNQQRRARAATVPAFNPAGPNSSSSSQSAASSSAGGDRASTNGSEASQTAAGGGRLPSSEVLMNLSLLVLENLNRQYGGGARASNASAAGSGARSEGATAGGGRGSPVLGGSVMRPVVEISSGIVPINQLIPLLAGAGHGLFAAATGTGHPLQFQNLLSAGPHATLASLLPPDMVDPQNPPESILADLFVTLAANLTLADLAAMAMDSHQLSATSGLQQARPALQRVVRTRLLRNQPLNETTATRATEIINAEIRPHLEVMLRETNLREDIDLVATISQLNHRQFPRMLSAIMEGSNFQTAIVIECYMYVRHFCAIMEYCCVQGAQGMDHIIRRILDNVALGVPGASRTIENLWRFLARTTSTDDDIQRFIVYRRPDVQRGADTETPSDAGAAAPEQQPMEVEVDSGVAGSREGGAVAAPSQEAVAASAPPPTTAPVPAPASATAPQVEVASDALPDVIIGSETWHSSLPSDWVPIITRDTQRQRRQSSQPPFSDAYLSGMPSKRRKIITAAKPQGSLSQVISENMQTAVSLAGVVAPGVETATVAQDASGDASLRLAYRDEVRSSVRRSLQSHPDYSPDKYPNAAKYFDAK